MSESIFFEIENELHRILDYWRSLEDEHYGGFIGRVSHNLTVDYEADKSGIAAVRNLWAFSRAHHLTDETHYLKMAEHAYAFFARHFLDSLHGGIYWGADFEGTIKDDRKHIYLQAFGIYALSEYYLASGTRRALEHAMKIWHLIEERGFDSEHGCYMEEFSREWRKLDNQLLSENGVNAEITANTHLHLLEAYTSLYRAMPTKPVREAIVRILDIFSDRIFSSENHHLRIFLDKDWNELIDLRSFGHDIEASWLVDEALKLLSLKEPRYHEMVTALAEQVLESAVEPDGSVVNEAENGEVDRRRIWWVQAEAAVGFFNAWEKTEDSRFYDAFIKSWGYISDSIIDRRPGGEWLYGRTPDGEPIKKDVAASWKAPYHNSRCCMELRSRAVKAGFLRL
ncbi:MAG: AGE family epimerase/isomerase [Spirochaetales bacterium]|uniref:Cellobiose 2-epimerase n=1 Tax=Candidatus Thalassospirochaeta sargassi TaxID=3119039 RepID=A0AAJ1IFE1_9SPIO|nr:AGE family epimerase/isomerase [Spirochaetales bacterium]